MSGASVPPDVPLPSETDQEMNFMTQRNRTASAASFPERMSVMFS